MKHELKIEKQWADAKLAGEKPFEIRLNDRGFQKGDTIHYVVIDPKTKEPYRIVPNSVLEVFEGSGRHPIETVDFIVTYMMQGFPGLQDGYCVYADQPVPITKQGENQ